MKSMDPNQKDLTKQDEIILGKIQGRSIGTNFKQIVQSIVGEINEEKLKAYLKQKTQQKNYGLTNKDQKYSIRQVKKLQLLKKYFDVNLITKKRRLNNCYRTFIKGLDKYIELYNKIVKDTDTEAIAKAFQQYQHLLNYEKNFITISKELEEYLSTEKSPIIPSAPYIHSSQPLQKIVQQGVLIQEQRKIQNIQIKTNHKNEQEQKKIQENIGSKTPNKGQNKRKKSTKNEHPNNSASLVAIQTNLGAQIVQKQRNQLNEQKEKRLQKQKQTTIKKKSNHLITQFLFKKKEVHPQSTLKKIIPLIIEQQKKIIKPDIIQQKKDLQKQKQMQIKKQEGVNSIWQNFINYQQFSKQTKSQMGALRSQIKGYKMQNQQLPNQPYYLNMVITLSTIQYYDYYMKIDRQISFAQPFYKIKNVFYFQDQSQQFEGQSACQQEQIEQQNDDQALSQGNNTILDDDHLSFQEISSCDSNQMEIKVQYGKAIKWTYNFKNCNHSLIGQKSEKQLISNDIAHQFSMICLAENQQKMPLRLQEDQSLKVQLVITPEIWTEVYKIAHAYSGTKDNIVKQLSAILPGMSKNWIDSMLKQRSQKIGNQRFIKKDFIDDIKQKVAQIDQILIKVLEQRNLQLLKIKQQKNQQKDLKLQKDILQCIGSRYIVNLLKQLKQKGYKQLRRTQLLEFINERKGQQWDKIRIEINTMSKPAQQMAKIMQRSNGQKIDEQVEVDDEQFNKIGDQLQTQIMKNKNCRRINKCKISKNQKIRILGIQLYKNFVKSEQKGSFC